MQSKITIGPDLIFSKKYRYVWHVLFWSLTLLFYTLFFGHQNRNYLHTFRFVSMLMPITIITTYFFIYFLIPRYFEKKKYDRFILFSGYTVLAAVYLALMASFAMVFWYIFEAGAPLDPTTIDVYFLIVAMFFVVLFAVAIKLLKSWYQRQQVMQEISHQKLEAELKMLRAQIQPHFLFNSLNSIYSLALVKSEKTPEMVLKLSEILDYLLYECDAPFVPLEKELNILKNYLDLQKIRFENRVSIKMLTDIQNESAKIAPMLLLPFAENCFKHGVSSTKNLVNIDMDIIADQSEFRFTIINDRPELSISTDEHGGIGLTNISRRLEVIYPNNHTLRIKEEKSRFHVSLQINLVE